MRINKRTLRLRHMKCWERSSTSNLYSQIIPRTHLAFIQSDSLFCNWLSAISFDLIEDFIHKIRFAADLDKTRIEYLYFPENKLIYYLLNFDSVRGRIIINKIHIELLCLKFSLATKRWDIYLNFINFSLLIKLFNVYRTVNCFVRKRC